MTKSSGASLKMTQFLDELFAQGVTFSMSEANLTVQDPYNTVTPRQKHMLNKHKWALMFTLHMYSENLTEERSADYSC